MTVRRWPVEEQSLCLIWVEFDESTKAEISQTEAFLGLLLKIYLLARHTISSGSSIIADEKRTGFEVDVHKRLLTD